MAHDPHFEQTVLAIPERIFFFDLGLSTYFFFFNLFLTRRGYTEARLGLLTGTLAAGNLAGSLLAPRLIRRIGLRLALILCLGSAPLVLLARALSPAFPLQVGLACAAGMALSLWAVCISPVIAALVDEHDRPLAFSLVFSLGIGVGAAGAIAGSRMPAWFSHAPSLTNYLAADQWTLIAASCLALAGLLPALSMRPVDRPAPRLSHPFFSPVLKRFLVSAAVWGLVTGSFSPFANVFLAGHLHLPLRNMGAVFSLSQFVQVLAVLCSPVLFRRFGLAGGVFVTQIGTALCFVALALCNRPVPASLTYITLTALQYMSEPGIYSMIMRIVPVEKRPGASASLAFVFAAAQLIAAACAGWTYTNLGYPATLGIIAGIAVMAGLLFRTISQAEPQSLVALAEERQTP